MRYAGTNTGLYAGVLGLSYNQHSEETRLVELDMHFEILIEAPAYTCVSFIITIIIIYFYTYIHTYTHTHTHTHTHTIISDEMCVCVCVHSL